MPQVGVLTHMRLHLEELDFDAGGQIGLVHRLAQLRHVVADTDQPRVAGAGDDRQHDHDGAETHQHLGADPHIVE